VVVLVRYQVELVALPGFLVLALLFLVWLSALTDYQSNRSYQTYFYADWLAFGTYHDTSHG
jgi:hypothetical protein